MRLETLSVTNFRGYSGPETMSFDDLTTIVGRNDVGKSTLLEALAIFFGDDVVKPDRSDLRVDSGEDFFEISCSFSGYSSSLVLDAQADTSLDQEHLLDANGQLTIVKRWKCSAARPKEEVFIECQHPVNEGLSDLLQLKSAELKSRLAEHLSAEEVGEVNKTSKPAMRSALWGSVDLELAETQLSVTKEDSKTIWDKLSQELPHFALFQSDRSSRDSDSEVQNPMKLAVESALADADLRETLQDVVEKVRARATELATRTHGVLEKLDPDIAKGLVPDFKNEPKWSSLFSVTLAGENGVSINKRGSGVRRLVLVSFFRAEAERKISEGDRQNIIYAIEEPETSQHPRYQKMLLEAFKQLSELEGSQVILTTHSPALAADLPASCLRFVSRNTGGNPFVAVGDEEILREIADELGVHADNRVRVIICVEGPNDVDAMRGLSTALHQENPDEFIDLATDPRVIIVPQGGGTLAQWVSSQYLRGFNRPEFHLFDRDDDGKYQSAVNEVNSRGDGSVAALTVRREIENYIHPSLLNEAIGVTIEITATTDVPKELSEKTKATEGVADMGESRVKRTLADTAFPSMTASLIDQIDPDGEVRGWFRTIANMAS